MSSRERVRIGVSVSADTVELCERLVADGIADNRSDALDVLAQAWLEREAQAELLAAAPTLDDQAEQDTPGVVGAPARRWGSVPS